MAKKLTNLEKSSFLKATIEDAVDFIDGSIAPDRETATRYYRGDLFGNEEEGRSQIVMTEVRDVVQAMMPSLLRVFLSSKDVVTFAPRRADAVQQAEQATEYINYILSTDNNIFTVLYAAFKDALVRKTGIVKWWKDERKTVTEDEFTGINEQQLALLLEDDTIEITEMDVDGSDFVDDPMTGQQIEQPTFKAKIRRTETDQKFVVEPVPVEEFLIARNARSIESADYVGHRAKRLVSDLVAEGYDEKEILQYGSPEPVFDTNNEAQARNPALHTKQLTEAANTDPAMNRVMYYESFVRMDADGDGVAELHRICSIGDSGHILHDEVVSEACFALFCPDPEPHTAIGQSIADQTKDLQEIKTNIVRNTLDSLAGAIHPRTGVVEGAVNMDDAMNTEQGAIIRMKAPGMVQELAKPFVGREALPILAYLDDIRAQRTGISRATQGLDAEVLQSTTKAAVDATVSAAQERLELVARIFAETGMRQLFRGLLRMVVKHQDKPRMIRLRQKWVEIDPRPWDAEMPVIVDMAAGRGKKAELLAALIQTSAKQELILQTLGPSNPLCDIAQYRNTLAKILELGGEIKDTSTYYKEIGPQEVQQFEQMAASSQKPDPAEILAQVEREKTMADIQTGREKMELEQTKAVMADDRERDRIEADAWLRAAEMQLKYGAQVNIAEIRSMMDRQRTFFDTAVRVNELENNKQQQRMLAAQPQGPQAQ